MSLTIESTVQLNNGTPMPLFGLGVFRIPAGRITKSSVLEAIRLGYRHIDTAESYGNEASVGEAIRESGVSRSEIFVTTKLTGGNQGFDSCTRAFNESLLRLGLDYVDLYLIHWPVKDLRLESWRAMEKLLIGGKVKAIGVSNFMVHHIEELLNHTDVVPAVNQIELHPYNFMYRKNLVDLCQAHGIQIEAYAPLTRRRKLRDRNLRKVAVKYGKTPAQILIRWALEHQFVVIPKSARPERIQENADVFDFTISVDDMDFLDSFNRNLIVCWDPTNAP